MRGNAIDDPKGWRHPPADRRRARNPSRVLGARAGHRPGGPGGARGKPRDRLHHGLEAVADHDGEGARPARRERASARVRGARSARTDGEAARRRSSRPGLRRLGCDARDAGSLVQEGFLRGARADQAIPGRTGGRQAMKELESRLGWALLAFLWQGTLVAALAAAGGALLRHRKAAARYTLFCGAMLLMLALPVATFFTHRAGEAIAGRE